MTNGQAKKIVEAIVDELSGRKGLRHEWEQIDPEIQDEIMQEWTKIVLAGSK